VEVVGGGEDVDVGVDEFVEDGLVGLPVKELFGRHAAS
jgi:hypothetical protein